MAYSEKIRSKKYRAYIARKRFLPAAVTLIGTAAAALTLALRNSLFTVRGGSLTAGVFILLFLATGAKRLFDKSYDGVVTDKRLRRVSTLEAGRGKPADRYILIVTDTHAKQHKSEFTVSVELISRVNSGDAFSHPGEAVEYFRRGDKVRHHAALRLYEKEDKSADRGILCCGCLTITDKTAAGCRRCGLPLLK